MQHHDNKLAVSYRVSISLPTDGGLFLSRMPAKVAYMFQWPVASSLLPRTCLTCRDPSTSGRFHYTWATRENMMHMSQENGTTIKVTSYIYRLVISQIRKTQKTVGDAQVSYLSSYHYVSTIIFANTPSNRLKVCNYNKSGKFLCHPYHKTPPTVGRRTTCALRYSSCHPVKKRQPSRRFVLILFSNFHPLHSNIVVRTRKSDYEKVPGSSCSLLRENILLKSYSL